LGLLFNIPINYLGYLETIGECLLAATVSVALFRLLILEEPPLFRFIGIKKGDVMEDKVVANVPVFVSYGWKQFRYAMLDSLISIAFAFSWDLLLYCLIVNEARHLLHSPQPFSIHPQPSKIFVILCGFLLRWVKETIEVLIYTPFILAFPYLATSEKISSVSVRKLVKAMKGNYLRIWIIAYLIFLPYHLLKHIQEWTIPFFAQMGIKHIEYVVYLNFHTLFFFTCNFAWIIFAANTYKNFAPTEIPESATN
jgi:hypothetical protein